MLSEEQVDIISEALTPLFDYLEHEVIVDIARRVAKTMEYTRTAELMVMDMQKLGYSPSKIRAQVIKALRKDSEFQKLVAKNTMEYKKEVKDLIKDIVEKAKLEGEEIVANAGEMAWIDDMRVWESGHIELTDKSFLAQLTRAFKEQLGDSIDNLSQSTGFKDVAGFENIEQMYTRELNKAIIKIASGTFSQEKVIEDTVHTLAQSGLRSIDYTSGKTMQLDSAVRLATRTSTHQISGRIQSENIKNTGVNLVYVSQHATARNEGTGIRNHEEWQGKVYRIGGRSEDFEEEAKRIGQSSIEDIWEKTGYSPDGTHVNNPLGLYGYNCRHVISPFWEGVSPLPDKLPPRKEVTYRGRNLDGYAQTQEMRRMERNIRNLKREREALKTLGQSTKEIEAEIKARTQDYKAFCDLCETKPSISKLAYECGTSDITQTKAYKKYKDM